MSNDELMQRSMAASYEEETKLRYDGSGNNQVGSTSSSGGSAPHEEFNKLALDFRPVSTSKTDKCRNFWIFIDSNPELGKIKDIGHRQKMGMMEGGKDVEQTGMSLTCFRSLAVSGLTPRISQSDHGSVEEITVKMELSESVTSLNRDDPTSDCLSRRIRFPSPQNSAHRRKWLNQLVEYKQLNLDRAAQQLAEELGRGEIAVHQESTVIHLRGLLSQALRESSDTSVSKLVHNVTEGPSGLLFGGSLSQERPLLGLSVKLTPDLMAPLVGALPELPLVDSRTQCNVLSSDPVRVRSTSEPLVLADQVSEPPEALHKALDGFDDQVKFPNPLQIYRTPVTLKNFLKKSQ
uniref:(California timema) hypothetical protein n=1 Tax=Timema californicum TaxID=61474 RepID=A0A7R9PC00_TIMCA|nr:unnamed protein product [Timema californicum]